MTTKTARLLLVYNADSGIINALKDAVWKQVSPGTYPCSLCAITYGAVSMHSDWRRFLESLPMQVVFHYKDDFGAAYPDHGMVLPVIAIAQADEEPRVLVSNDELDQIKTTTELMDQVRSALASEHLRSPDLRVVG